MAKNKEQYPRGHELRNVCFKTEECGRRGKAFHNEGRDVAMEFCQFLLDREFEKYTLVFHNGGAYDTYFIARFLFETRRKLPRVIYRGSKIVAIDTGDLRVVDSINFLGFPLAQMPGIFQLKDVRKGTFPHFFNREENWSYVGPLPDPADYGVDSMKPKVREEFLRWHHEQKGRTFHFKDEILAYCEDDVNILQESCNTFRQWLIGITSREEIVDVGEGGERKTRKIGIDPLQYNTLASVCMATYRHMFLTEKHTVELTDGRTVTGLLKNSEMKLFDQEGNSIDPKSVGVKSTKFVSSPFAKMPACGFSGLDTHSRSSILWLESEARRLGVHITHARNGGEHRVRSKSGKGWLKLDGYSKNEQTGEEQAWEYMGCVFHGCRKCYGDATDPVRPKHPHTGESLDALYKETEKRLDYLRTELKLTVHVVWECQFTKLLKENPDLQALALELDLQPRLDPRNSFYGGRTNAVKLFQESEKGQRIGYADICSLYPMVLKNDEFPVGIPEVLVSPSSNDISGYFGIIQARVRPPRGLYHPCLPMRCNGKLLFPLCRSCAQAAHQQKCLCDDEARDLVGTWTSVDLEDALQVGYVIIKIYEVYNFKERTSYNKNEAN
jgi:hypothetical protein